MNNTSEYNKPKTLHPNNNSIKSKSSSLPKFLHKKLKIIMCRSKKKATSATSPSPPSRHHPSTSSSTSYNNNNPSTTFKTTTSSTNFTTTSSTSHHSSSRHSLSSLRSSLPDNPLLYDISEIRHATNNFLAKNFTTTTTSFSSSFSRCWRCSLRGKDVLVFQRKSNGGQELLVNDIRQQLSSICKSHHVAIVNLLGASVSGEYVYLVYEFVNGANLFELLHNVNNSNFTVLSSWMSRMQIATDVANGLDYIHNNTGLGVKFVHNHITSNSVVVTEPSFNAKICHFGTSELSGEPTEERENGECDYDGKAQKVEEIVDEEDEKGGFSPKLTRSNSTRFNGTTGFMSPEFQMTGVGTRKSDVYAFGVVLVELLSGEEAVKYKYNKATNEYIKTSAVDMARELVEEGSGGGEREGRLRKWIDRRLRDSYPVEVADKMTRLAVECLNVDPNKRPNMRRVAGKISKLYLESQVWCEKMRIPTDITVSFAPR